MISTGPVNSRPYIPLMSHKADKGTSPEPAGPPSEDLNGLFSAQLFFMLEPHQRIFTIAKHAMNSISSAKNISTFYPYFPVLFVYLVNSHLSLKTQFKYHFLSVNFPVDPAE